MTTLFVSDVHLSERRPARVEAFLELLRGPAGRCEALYLLGDLFDLWLGARLRFLRDFGSRSLFDRVAASFHRALHAFLLPIRSTEF